MKLDGIRERVFLDRYSLKDKTGKPNWKIRRNVEKSSKGIVKAEKNKDRNKLKKVLWGNARF